MNGYSGGALRVNSIMLCCVCMKIVVLTIWYSGTKIKLVATRVLKRETMQEWHG